MKRIILFLITFLFPLNFFTKLSGQAGEPILKVYSDFYKGLREEDPGTALEIKRVYLGY
ncbi:MAG: hypothetical protein ACOCWA_07875 [Bacteroidota bacterium]